jgi:hypothetical protein
MKSDHSIPSTDLSMTGRPFTPKDEMGHSSPARNRERRERSLGSPLGRAFLALGIATTFSTELSGAQATKRRSVTFAALCWR